MAELTVPTIDGSRKLVPTVRAAIPAVTSPVWGAAAIAACFAALAFYLGWHETLDDTAISLAYAKNLVHGHGLVLTAHADPVEGYSNFLWVLVMAPVIGLHLDGIAASKLIGLAFGTGALLVLALIPGAIAHRAGRWFDLLAPALTAVSLPFALWSISGLENGLESFLIVLAVYLSIRELDDDDARPWSAIAFFALALTRPDGIVFWIAAIGHRALLALLGRRQLRRDAIWVLACLVPLGLYHVWHYAYFGDVVPNTYYAKASERTLGELLDYLTANDPGVLYLRSFAEDYWIVMLLAPFAPLSLLSSRGLRRYLLPLLMLAAGALSVLFSGGDWMPFHRFICPLLPLFFLCVVQGIDTCVGAIARALRIEHSRAAIVAIGIGALALLGATAAVNMPRADDIHEEPYGADYNLILAIGKYADDLGARIGVDEPLVALPDIGGPAYGTDIEIVDIAGLADAYVAKHPAGEQFNDYIFGDRKPDIIFVHDVWIRRTGIDQDARLHNDYVAYASTYNPLGALTSGTFIRNDLVLPVRSCPDAISWQAAGFATGTSAQVVGPVLAVRPAVGGRSVLLDVGGPARFSVILTPKTLQELKLPAESVFLGRTICVDGVIQGVRGVPIVTADSIDNIALEQH